MDRLEYFSFLPTIYVATHLILLGRDNLFCWSADPQHFGFFHLKFRGHQ